MSDAAFQAMPFSGSTLAELRALPQGRSTPAIDREIARREAIERGDYSDSYPAERRRYIAANPTHRFVRDQDGKGWKIETA